MVPVTALPPQVTVQSTPALLLSPVGVMLRFAVSVTLKVLVETEIAPALTLDTELPPHPIFKRLSTLTHTAPTATKTQCMALICFPGNRRISLDSMNRCSLFLPVQGRIALSCCVYAMRCVLQFLGHTEHFCQSPLGTPVRGLVTFREFFRQCQVLFCRVNQ
jgi:hypothetical protein